MPCFIFYLRSSNCVCRLLPNATPQCFNLRRHRVPSLIPLIEHEAHLPDFLPVPAKWNEPSCQDSDFFSPVNLQVPHIRRMCDLSALTGAAHDVLLVVPPSYVELVWYTQR